MYEGSTSFGSSVGKIFAVGLKVNLMVPTVLFKVADGAEVGGGVVSSVSIAVGTCICSFCFARSVTLSERDLLVLLPPDVATECERERLLADLA